MHSRINTIIIREIIIRYVILSYTVPPKPLLEMRAKKQMDERSVMSVCFLSEACWVCKNDTTMGYGAGRKAHGRYYDDHTLQVILITWHEKAYETLTRRRHNATALAATIMILLLFACSIWKWRINLKRLRHVLMRRLISEQIALFEGRTPPDTKCQLASVNDPCTPDKKIFARTKTNYHRDKRKAS